MNLALFFEGTGQGVAGEFTNVTRLRDLCVEDAAQHLLLEPGPGTHFGAYAVGSIHGIGWRQITARAIRWFEREFAAAAEASPAVYLFGFSRGALIARHVAHLLHARSIAVAYLGLWDTVDSTVNLDVEEACPANVAVARQAVARDERRAFFRFVPIRASSPRQSVRQLVFPGAHSDVGGLYADNHVIADAALDWIAQGAVAAGLRLRPGTRLRAHRDWAQAVLHDSQREASNLWGALGPVVRPLRGLRRHVSCRLKMI